MAFCPNCGRDHFNKRHYQTTFTPPQIKIYWACLKCGFTEEGYYTTPAEMAEIERREREGDEETESDLE